MGTQTASPDPGNSRTEWTLRALGLARATGAPVLACLAGLQAAPAALGSFALGFAEKPAPQRLGLVEMAMLADLTMGGALRQEVGRTRPLPTLSLTLDLAGPHGDEGSSVTAVAHDIAVGDGVGTAAGSLRGPRTVVGHCAATFAIPTRGRQEELPWDNPEGTHQHGTSAPLRPSDLSDDDQLLLRSVLAAQETDRSWGDHLVMEATTGSPDGYELIPTPAMTNRAGAVQGGVLFALAAHCAIARDERSRPRLVSGTMRFLSGTDAAMPVTVVPLAEHATRRSVFAQVRILQDEDIRAVAGLVYRL
ncbi:hypothetical protein [Nonomuraea sp. NPDC049750]|uniref:PaaI family thioesterase n=1 Tax=Nonomuraea sp. NPDC049750 TaxID=3154738 RepID=UPI0033D4DF56